MSVEISLRKGCCCRVNTRSGSRRKQAAAELERLPFESRPPDTLPACCELHHLLLASIFQHYSSLAAKLLWDELLFSLLVSNLLVHKQKVLSRRWQD